MTLRNIGLVFGPTLVRKSGDGPSDLNELNAMSASYAIVETLCKEVGQRVVDGMCACVTLFHMQPSVEYAFLNRSNQANI